MTRATLLILSVLLVAASPSTPAQHPASGDIAGVYRCDGTNGNGEPYSGVVVIERHHDAYQLQWSFSGNADAVGIGIRSGNTLSVSYFGDRPGVVAYEIAGNRLSGRWTVVGGDGVLADETLTLIHAGSQDAAPQRPPRDDDRDQPNREPREEPAPRTPRIRV